MIIKIVFYVEYFGSGDKFGINVVGVEFLICF